jgi:hypothetical protein
MSSLLPIYPPRHLAPAPELNGTLSPSEVADIPESDATDPDAVEAFRHSYEKAIQRANDARAHLLDAFKQPRTPGDTWMRIDAHARAQRWLWHSAEAICDAEDLEDDGYREGIVWETPLCIKPEPEAA